MTTPQQEPDALGVYESLTDHQKMRTSLENVMDVMAALRAAPPAAPAMEQEPVALPFRKSLERLLDEAEHPKGMSVHDGKAHVPADWIRYLLKRLDMSAPTAAPATQQAPQLHPTDIYNFAGWLTTRHGRMEVGDVCDAAPMADAVNEYLKTFPDRFAPPAAPAVTDERAKAFDEFVEYVARNYSGEVVFSNPQWHAERLWRAAHRQASASRRRDDPCPQCSSLRATITTLQDDINKRRTDNEALEAIVWGRYSNKDANAILTEARDLWVSMKERLEKAESSRRVTDAQIEEIKRLLDDWEIFAPQDGRPYLAEVRAALHKALEGLK